MAARLRQADLEMKKHWILIVLLFLLIFWRLPNFFEPYWYGDEGIYLTIGQSLAAGERLYAEIIDHKTPLIYYLAMAPNQLWFRVLLTAWMIVTTLAFYRVARALLHHTVSWTLTTFLFIFFTTMPWLEGNIPNGELFVMGFVIVAMAILIRTPFFQVLAHTDKTTLTRYSLHLKRYLGAGVLLGLGILTKVPALFDFAAVLSIAWIALSRPALLRWGELKKAGLVTWLWPIVPTILITIGAILPIAVSVVYFIARGSGQAYLDFGLLYNFRYAGSWTLPFSNNVLLFLFTLPGKVMVMAVVGTLITLAAKWLRPATQFALFWLVLATFASLLSNRPYPHYFLQLIPPAALLLGCWWENCRHRLPHQTSSQYRAEAAVTSVFTISIVGAIISVMLLLGVYFYPTVRYYQNWLGLMTSQQTLTEYRQRFNSVMADNYAAAEIIKPCPDEHLFIWGTNPMLYALTKKVPTGRFTVAFHIKDFDAYAETLTDVQEKQPTFIVVMNQDEDTFPELTTYLNAHYMPNTSFEHFTLWKRL